MRHHENPYRKQPPFIQSGGTTPGTRGNGWDILIKVKANDVDSIGKFVVDKLRLVKGIQKTLTCVVFETEKESTAIPL